MTGNEIQGAQAMLKVGFVGCGEMGEPMAGHVLKTKKFEVWVYDIRAAATKAIATRESGHPEQS